MTALVFDLDGTLSDPAEGLLAAINHGLEASGVPARDPADLARFIGPSLDRIYGELLDTDDPERLRNAIEAYRDVYYRDGYKQNRLYEGIIDALECLSGRGFRLYVATAKRQDIAGKVVEHFGLTRFFHGVLGCGLKRQKHELLEDIQAAETRRPLIMIGDRANDMEAARAVGAEAVGVLWGYGDEAELRGAGATRLLTAPAELLSAFPS
jgi:phosphoglycolate phosphatase